MKIPRTTLVALQATVDIAAAGRRALPVSEIAARRGLPRATLAKVLHALARAGLLAGRRGAAGGYRLARPAASISVLEIFELFESPSRRRGERMPEKLAGLLSELSEIVRCTLASVTLETLARRTARVEPGAAEPGRPGSSEAGNAAPARPAARA